MKTKFKELVGTGVVVNFISRNAGTVVKGNRQYKVGFYSDKWISSEDNYMWADCKVKRIKDEN